MFINDATSFSFSTVCYSLLRPDSLHYHVLSAIYNRISFIFRNIVCVRRRVSSHQNTVCYDQHVSIYHLLYLYSELATRLCLPLKLRIINYLQLQYRNVNQLFESKLSTIPTDTSFYTSTIPTGAIPLVASKVSLPSIGDAVSNIELHTVLPKSVSDYYSDVNALLLPTCSTPISTKTPTVFCSSRTEYTKLLHRLFELKMIDFTSTPKCVNGLFGVKKDEDSIRLIVDATYVNSLMIPPPVVTLPNPSHLSNLKTSDPFYVAKMDLSNYYHQLELPSVLQDWFCLPHISIAELQSIFPNAIIGSVRMYPKLRTLPMGWAHSVYIAQVVHEHVVYSMYAALSPINNILINSVLLLSLHFIYIDDLVLIGYDRNVLEQQIAAIKHAYAAVGLKLNIKKSIAPTQHTIKIIGVSINGSTQRIFVDGIDIISLVSRTVVLLQAGECTSHAMSVLVGHWCWFLLLKRPLLSIMNQCYRFIQTFLKNVDLKYIWSSVHRELLMCCTLASNIQLDLSTQVIDRVVATDASMNGFGMVTNRTNEMDDQLYDKLVQLAVNTGTNSFECESNAFGLVGTVAALVNSSTIPVVSLQPVISLTNTSRMQQHQQIVQLVREISIIVDWVIITRGCWKYNDESTHINELEMSSVLLAVRWLCSLVLVRTSKRKLILLVDNAVTVYAVRKGRSSSLPLLKLLRRITAYCVALDVQLKIVYVPSNLNPADAASRMGTTITN